jgi:hypothetical protein
MTEVTFEVNPTTAQWGYDDTAYPSGTPHTVDADGDFAAALAAADAAGAIKVTEGKRSLPTDHIETDKQSLAFRSKVDGLRAASQSERDEFVRQVERSLNERVVDEDDDFGAADARAELEASVNQLDVELHGTEIEELKGA